MFPSRYRYLILSTTCDNYTQPNAMSFEQDVCKCLLFIISCFYKRQANGKKLFVNVVRKRQTSIIAILNFQKTAETTSCLLASRSLLTSVHRLSTVTSWARMTAPKFLARHLRRMTRNAYVNWLVNWQAVRSCELYIGVSHCSLARVMMASGNRLSSRCTNV